MACLNIDILLWWQNHSVVTRLLQSKMLVKLSGPQHVQTIYSHGYMVTIKVAIVKLCEH